MSSRFISVTLCSVLFLFALLPAVAQEPSQPNATTAAPVRIRPEEARQHVGRLVEVTFVVKKTKYNPMRNLVYLDSMTDWKDPRNLGVMLTSEGLADLKQNRHIDSPVDFYRDKKIRAVGTITIEEDNPFLKVIKSDQIELVKSSEQTQ